MPARNRVHGRVCSTAGNGDAASGLFFHLRQNRFGDTSIGVRGQRLQGGGASRGFRGGVFGTALGLGLTTFGDLLGRDRDGTLADGVEHHIEHRDAAEGDEKEFCAAKGTHFAIIGPSPRALGAIPSADGGLAGGGLSPAFRRRGRMTPQSRMIPESGERPRPAAWYRCAPLN
jgi:hypothetical protein